MNIKRLSVIQLAVCFLLTMGLAGCGSAGDSLTATSTANSQVSTVEKVSETTQEALPQVELKYYTLGYKQPEDTEVVEKAMNDILLKKINATVKLTIYPFGNYDQKMKVMSAAGEEFDLMFCTDYLNNAAKGAYTDLTDLIPKYAPELQNTMEPYIFDATRVDGRIYAVPNLQAMCMPIELMIRKDLFDKYNMPSSIQSFDELDDTFDKILNNDKVIPLYVYYSGEGNTVYMYYSDCGNFFSVSGPGVYTPDFKVQNIYDTDNFKGWLKWARKAYLKGWIEKGAATKDATQTISDMKSGKYAAIFNPGGPQGQASRNLQLGTDKYQYTFINFGTKPIIHTGQPRATMNGISSTSKNPERAMMLLNLLSTDKEVFNTIAFGIEGKHYILDNGFRDFPEGQNADNSKYYLNTPWAFGNLFLALPAKGDDPQLMEKQKEFDATATPEPAMGFTYDATAMKTEFAQVASVVEEFVPSMAVGAVDPDVYLPKLLDKLKTAGVDKIIADQQAQLDKFIASKK
jgi:putative aldouronate transport system substrate-binding protein